MMCDKNTLMWYDISLQPVLHFLSLTSGVFFVQNAVHVVDLHAICVPVKPSNRKTQSFKFHGVPLIATTASASAVPYVAFVNT